MALAPACMHDQTRDLAWKLYELDSRLYLGRPKDGSIRTVDVPPLASRSRRPPGGAFRGWRHACRPAGRPPRPVGGSPVRPPAE